MSIDELDDELAAHDSEEEAENVPAALFAEAAAGQEPTRIDRFLAEALALPRNRIQRYIEQGRVEVGGRTVPRTSTLIHAGQQVRVLPPPRVDERIVPEEGPLEILYQDDDLIAIDKSAGIAVHPGAGRPTGTLVHFLLHRYPELVGVGGPGRPGIVHRLDLDTTGVLLVARNDFAYQALQRLFAERQLEKTYLALVHGEPKENRGRIDLPIGRHQGERQKMAIRENGRPAVTRWELVAGRKAFSLLRFGLETGRTHQIRVHAKAIGHPLIGDPVYGEARWRAAPRPLQRILASFSRPALHARRLAFLHPRSHKRLEIEAPVPQDLQDLWQNLAGKPWPDA